MQRLKALEQQHKDGHWRMAAKIELLFFAIKVIDYVAESKLDNGNGIMRDAVMALGRILLRGCGAVSEGCFVAVRGVSSQVMIIVIDPCLQQTCMEDFQVVSAVSVVFTL